MAQRREERKNLSYNPHQQGPTPVTGIFDTREELEREVARLLESGLSQKKIAKQVSVTPATMCNIVKNIRYKERARERGLRDWMMLGRWHEGVPEELQK